MVCKRCELRMEEEKKISENSNVKFGQIKCAFDENGKFIPMDNQRCGTIRDLREIAYASGFYGTYDDESVACIPHSKEDSNGEIINNGFIIMNWYKNRGRTYDALYIHDRGNHESLTLEEAESFLDKSELAEEYYKKKEEKELARSEVPIQSEPDFSSLYPLPSQSTNNGSKIDNMIEYIEKENLIEIINWKHVSEIENLSEENIIKYSDKLDWVKLSENQKLSENIIREFQDKVHWNLISMNQKLSEDFIREFQDKVNWDSISYFQNISEGFIREFIDKIEWTAISFYSKLSEEFIREYASKLDWEGINEKQTHLSKEFIDEMKTKLGLED